MKKHRGLFLALGLCGLLGLFSQSANAGTITMVISFSGGSITVTPTTNSVAGSSNALLTANAVTINGDLKRDGVNLSFSSLGASSVNGSGVPYPTSGVLSESGSAAYAANGGSINSVTIMTSLTGYTAPTGAGTLDSSTTVNMTGTNAGDTQGSSTSFNSATVTTFPTYTSTGPANQTPLETPVMTGVGTVTGTYGLNNSATISLTAGSDSFSVSTQLTASSVPEPASIILMLTSMPLPLVVMGLIRRRRRAAA